MEWYHPSVETNKQQKNTGKAEDKKKQSMKLPLKLPLPSQSDILISKHAGIFQKDFFLSRL